jgi:hypothetical protein
VKTQQSKAAIKVPVSERAVMQRINRLLAKDGEMLKKSRPSKFHNRLGDFYRLDVQHNAIIEMNVNLEALAQEKNVLAKWEVLEQ